ncbi:MAG TPA: methylated-DNA--[protein]-cysteine S-methyltransferase [Polyangiaceae bacterium]|jgi:methylated-DNA-[protein]-cysteine S-methyltransferase
MTAPVTLLIDRLPTPVGPFALVADEEGRLRAAGFLDEHPRMERQVLAWSRLRDARLEERANPHGLTGVMARYFDGDLAALDGLPVLAEGTAFQRRVWEALRRIPCGETWSYARLARHIGRPTAVRAVGLANGANPVAVVVPCHRVIGSDGTLTGYGGGLQRKRWLLRHEGCAPRGTPTLWADV